ncbi:Arf family guanine nucleotide exchange factor [Saccharomycopsis crataegensis]|uniref:Protein transport protein Sec61 subunit beta n=1 Tax=Saccharomycopsis crataegensis TaxID=43959 RepID=A0AAV5QSV8_9ASCO|nr:Arf family guanine nucleotide exchange factor [Saccharomycopsis crataegensis]
MSSSAVPGGARTLAKRRNAKDKASSTPNSARSAGANGSSAAMLKLFTDEADGLNVDPLVVLFLSVGFIFSVIALHVIAKITGKLTA